MFKNYLTIALRNLWKRRTHTVINVLGLAIGIASAIIIFLIVRYELSFDQFHEKADRVYRVTTAFHSNDGNTYSNAGGARPLPGALRQDFVDDMEEVVSIERYSGHRRIRVDSQTIFLENAVVYTDNAYFTLFSFPVLVGNRSTILRQPNEVVITRQLSQRLFDTPEAAIGSVIDLNGQYDLQVVGVLADYPNNTGFNFDMLISATTRPHNAEEDNAWDHFNSSFQTYVLLSPRVEAHSVVSRFPEFVLKYRGEEDTKHGMRDLYLQPLTDIHLEGQYGDFPFRKTDRNVLSGLVILAVLLILLACINFVNLATAISTQRTKEIGVRKVVGSSRRQIILLFLGEAWFVTVLAVGLALGLVELGLLHLRQSYPFLNAVHLTINPGLVLFLALLITTVTGLAGFYPAWMLSGYRPVHMFQRTWSLPRQRYFSVRQVLVIFQFFIAQAFILGVLVVGQQLTFLLEAPLGFNQEAVITINFPDDDSQKQRGFKQRLQNYTGVESLSLSMFTAISQYMSSTNFGYDEKSKDESEEYSWLQAADVDYFDTHQMTFLAGEVYAPADSGSGFVVNEAFVQKVGAASPEEVVGKYVTMNSLELPIVGVVADYHVSTFDSEIAPLLITNYRPWYSHLNLKVRVGQADEVIAQLESLWQKNYPDFPFTYRFLDDAIAEFYQEYRRLLSLTRLFSGIAIFIGCLGLYGLVVFMAEQRTKEIGIRKVLGASVQQLLSLFSGQFVKLVVIAFCLAAPLAYFLMTQWLQSFVYRIEINALMFAGCLLISLLLVLLTVGYQSVRAAMANPVASLKNE